MAPSYRRFVCLILLIFMSPHSSWAGATSAEQAHWQTMTDFYEILGVAKTASEEEIKKAKRLAAKKYHPDVNPDPRAAERMKEINLAYEVLIDPEKRYEYDNLKKSPWRSAAQNPTQSSAQNSHSTHTSNSSNTSHGWNDLRNYSDDEYITFERALSFGMKPVWEGGLGLDEQEAFSYASKMAKKLPSNKYAEWLERYKAAFSYVKLTEVYGEAAKNSALNLANTKTLQEIQNLESNYYQSYYQNTSHSDSQADRDPYRSSQSSSRSQGHQTHGNSSKESIEKHEIAMKLAALEGLDGERAKTTASTLATYYTLEELKQKLSNSSGSSSSQSSQTNNQTHESQRHQTYGECMHEAMKSRTRF